MSAQTELLGREDTFGRHLELINHMHPGAPGQKVLFVEQKSPQQTLTFCPSVELCQPVVGSHTKLSRCQVLDLLIFRKIFLFRYNSLCTVCCT